MDERLFDEKLLAQLIECMSYLIYIHFVLFLVFNVVEPKTIFHMDNKVIELN